MSGPLKGHRSQCREVGIHPRYCIFGSGICTVVNKHLMVVTISFRRYIYTMYSVCSFVIHCVFILFAAPFRLHVFMCVFAVRYWTGLTKNLFFKVCNFGLCINVFCLSSALYSNTVMQVVLGSSDDKGGCHPRMTTSDNLGLCCYPEPHSALKRLWASTMLRPGFHSGEHANVHLPV
jgi:hypothetical protein